MTFPALRQILELAAYAGTDVKAASLELAAASAEVERLTTFKGGKCPVCSTDMNQLVDLRADKERLRGHLRWALHRIESGIIMSNRVMLWCGACGASVTWASNPFPNNAHRPDCPYAAAQKELE